MFDIFLACDLCGAPHTSWTCHLFEPPQKVSDRVVPSRAHMTLPSSLCVTGTGDNCGVITLNSMEKGTQFGPFQAPRQDKLKELPSILFQIFGPIDLGQFLDTSDKNFCNWMCLVRPARCEEESNLMAFQGRKDIFFRTRRIINEGEELLVYYSSFYSKKIEFSLQALRSGRRGNTGYTDGQSLQLSYNTTTNSQAAITYSETERNTESQALNDEAVSTEVATYDNRDPDPEPPPVEVVITEGTHYQHTANHHIAVVPSEISVDRSTFANTETSPEQVVHPRDPSFRNTETDSEHAQVQEFVTVAIADRVTEVPTFEEVYFEIPTYGGTIVETLPTAVAVDVSAAPSPVPQEEEEPFEIPTYGGTIVDLSAEAENSFETSNEESTFADSSVAAEDTSASQNEDHVESAAVVETPDVAEAFQMHFHEQIFMHSTPSTSGIKRKRGRPPKRIAPIEETLFTRLVNEDENSVKRAKSSDDFRMSGTASEPNQTPSVSTVEVDVRSLPKQAINIPDKKRWDCSRCGAIYEDGLDFSRHFQSHFATSPRPVRVKNVKKEVKYGKRRSLMGRRRAIRKPKKTLQCVLFDENETSPKKSLHDPSAETSGSPSPENTVDMREESFEKFYSATSSQEVHEIPDDLPLNVLISATEELAKQASQQSPSLSKKHETILPTSDSSEELQRELSRTPPPNTDVEISDDLPLCLLISACEDLSKRDLEASLASDKTTTSPAPVNNEQLQEQVDTPASKGETSKHSSPTPSVAVRQEVPQKMSRRKAAFANKRVIVRETLPYPSVDENVELNVELFDKRSVVDDVEEPPMHIDSGEIPKTSSTIYKEPDKDELQSTDKEESSNVLQITPSSSEVLPRRTSRRKSSMIKRLPVVQEKTESSTISTDKDLPREMPVPVDEDTTCENAPASTAASKNLNKGVPRRKSVTFSDELVSQPLKSTTAVEALQLLDTHSQVVAEVIKQKEDSSVSEDKKVNIKTSKSSTVIEVVPSFTKSPAEVASEASTSKPNQASTTADILSSPKMSLRSSGASKNVELPKPSSPSEESLNTTSKPLAAETSETVKTTPSTENESSNQAAENIVPVRKPENLTPIVAKQCRVGLKKLPDCILKEKFFTIPSSISTDESDPFEKKLLSPEKKPVQLPVSTNIDTSNEKSTVEESIATKKPEEISKVGGKSGATQILETPILPKRPRGRPKKFIGTTAEDSGWKIEKRSKPVVQKKVQEKVAKDANTITSEGSFKVPLPVDGKKSSDSQAYNFRTKRTYIVLSENEESEVDLSCCGDSDYKEEVSSDDDSAEYMESYLNNMANSELQADDRATSKELVLSVKNNGVSDRPQEEEKKQLALVKSPDVASGKRPSDLENEGRHILSEINEMDYIDEEFNEDDGNPRVFECDICGKCFSKSESLFLHTKKHTGDFACSKCQTVFARKETLRNHNCRGLRTVRCQLCVKTFSSFRLLEKHLRAHERPFRCEECKKSFTTKEMMQKHACSNSKTEVACPVCGKVFSNGFLLGRHLPVHTGQFSCPYCTKWFSSSLTAHTHFNTCKEVSDITQQGSKKCNICDLDFQDVREYRYHEYSHTHPFRCLDCDGHFTEKVRLQTHKCTDIEIPCPYCNKMFDRVASLQSHTCIKFRKPFQCLQCLFSFKHLSELQNHNCDQEASSSRLRRKSRTENTGPMICEQCGREFSSTSSLNAHKVLHGEKKYECHLCSKRFFRKDQLEHHASVHGTPTMPCPQCGKLFKSKRYLSIHARIHASVRMYHCSVCQKGFNQRGNLMKHMDHHKEPKVYICEECGKQLKHRETYEKHVQSHRIGNKVACSFCDKTFYTNTYLRNHIQICHQNQQYKCKYCSAITKRRQSMIRHLSKKHSAHMSEWRLPSILNAMSIASEIVENSVTVDVSGNRTDADTEDAKILLAIASLQDSSRFAEPQVVGAEEIIHSSNINITPDNCVALPVEYILPTQEVMHEGGEPVQVYGEQIQYHFVSEDPVSADGFGSVQHQVVVSDTVVLSDQQIEELRLKFHETHSGTIVLEDGIVIQQQQVQGGSDDIIFYVIPPSEIVTQDN